MPAERYYLNAPLEKDRQVTLSDQEFLHLTRVMRTREGETVELIDGQGRLAHAVVDAIEKRQARLSIEQVINEPKPSFDIILAQAIPRINRLDFIVEKGTELGMTQLWLFPGDYSERKEISQQQLERVKAMTVAASKQCGRLWLPDIFLKPSIKEWKTMPLGIYYGDVSPDAEPFDSVWKAHPPDGDGVIVCVGPESGFSPQEEAHLRQLEARGVKLHPNILRTDTAALVFLSLIASKI